MRTRVVRLCRSRGGEESMAGVLPTGRSKSTCKEQELTDCGGG